MPGRLIVVLRCSECGERFTKDFENSDEWAKLLHVGKTLKFPHAPCYEAYMRKDYFRIMKPGAAPPPLGPDRFLARVEATQRPYPAPR